MGKLTHNEGFLETYGRRKKRPISEKYPDEDGFYWTLAFSIKMGNAYPPNTEMEKSVSYI